MTAIMVESKFCTFSVTVFVFLVFASVVACQEQRQQQHQQQQTHHMPQTTQQRSTSGTRWNRRQQQVHPTTTLSPPSSAACDYKELLSNLHDRVGILASLDEDQRNRLEAISKKVIQFETSNLVRLDSLSVQQMDILKRLDSMELLQRMTKRELELLQSLLASTAAAADTKTTTTTTQTKNSNNEQQESKSTEVNHNDLSVPRHIRDAPEEQQQGNENLSESEKLDALSTLLVSTRVALNTLQVTLESDVERVLQETNKLNRRVSNLQRRQNQQQFHNQQPNQFFGGYLPGPTQGHQLVTNCGQGAPTSHGILRLHLTENSEPFYVRCDEDYMNGGWTIIQNRFTGELNFQRDWSEYKNGFGNLASEFFIGLDKLHALTSNAVQELVIVLEDFEGTQTYAKYDLFAIGNEAESYALKLLGEFNGTAGDSLSYHAGSKFSTFDNDNDGCVECNCAQAHLGAWWYNWCEQSNLNGKYYKENETVSRYTGMYWHTFNGPNVSLRASRMMIRPVVLDQENQR